MSRPLIVAYNGNVSNVLLVPLNGGPPSGIEGLLITMVMEALAVSYKLVHRKEFKTKPRVSIRNLIYDGTVDVGVSQMITSESKFEAQYTTPYIYSDINFATNLPQMKPKMISYLYSFDITTWVLIATVSVVAPIAFGALFKVGDFSNIWLGMFGNLLGRSVPQRMRGPSQTIFMVALWFGSMVLFYSYSGVILSCLTVPTMEQPPKNFKELAKAIQNDEYTALIRRGSYVDFIWNKSRNSDVVYIRDIMQKNGWFYRDASAYRKTFKPRTAYIASSFHMKLYFGVEPYASKHLSEGICPFYGAMIVNPRNYKLKKRMDAIISKIIQGGLLDKILKDHFFKVWLKSSSHREAEGPVSPLSLKDVVGAFVVLVSGLCASTVVFIIEYVCPKFRKTELSSHPSHDMSDAESHRFDDRHININI